MRHELTGILTTKIEDDAPATAPRYGFMPFMPFMADCAVLLNQRVTDRVAVRSMRVLKYRGSPHVLNEMPFVIGPDGVEVGSVNGVHPEPQPFNERVSTGIERLDEMLGGGFYRGTNALVTASSGAGKSMLPGVFIEAACRRGERALFISFNENSHDITRDLATVSIHLAPHLESGLLRMEAAPSEEHFMRIKRLIAEHEPRCVAIESALGARPRRWRTRRARRRRAADLSVPKRGCHRALHEPARGLRSAVGDDHAARLDDLGLMDPSHLCARRRRAQPLSVDYQITRLEAFQSTARADLQRQGRDHRRSIRVRSKGFRRGAA